MDQYIARQPILDIYQRLYAYELLYRGADHYALDKVSGNKATTSLLSSAFLTQGIAQISDNKPCFVNFTEELIIQRIPASFPTKKLVVEILENVQVTENLLVSCRFLKEKGYQIALDDFVYDRKFEPLLELTDIVKIDVRLTPLNTIHKTLKFLHPHRVKLLAEKVESLNEFELANKLGFKYFQGYYFSKPEKIQIKEVSAAKINIINLLAEVSRKTTDINRLHSIISVDIAISYKLLRFLNSAYFYRLQKVKHVKHAIAYLGESELRRFILLVLVAELTSGKPDELVRIAVVRAKFLELMVKGTYLGDQSSELFLVGLFSLLDVMLNVTMSDVMEKLPLEEAIKNALINMQGPYSPFLRIVIAYERNQIRQLTEELKNVGMESDRISNFYLEAVRYAKGLLL